QWRRLRRRLFLLCDRAGLARAFLLDRDRLFPIPNSFRARIFVAVLLEIFVEPATTIIAGGDAEFTVHFKIGARLKCADLFLARRENGERRRLHTTGRRFLKAARA